MPPPNMEKVEQKKLELLAPAGSIESFFAAVESGADAVFCGLQQFSARAKAKNVSIHELERLIGFARIRNVKVYVPLNTLFQEMDLPPLVEILEALASFEVDGVIIQDLGLYSLLKDFFPTIPIHGSTQLVCHNIAGAQMLERMGFKRVVLARELTIHEIAAISKACSIALEHFVHGAMCYSISGHCLFSSYLNGCSGNRGRCMQPCRRKYHYGQRNGFYFSTSDFSAIDSLPQLIEAGVTSFKIEGRMKSAEYVASVVKGYRMVLDAYPTLQGDTLKNAHEALQEAMGRSSSHGFLHGTSNRKLVLEQQKGGLGKTIATIQRVEKGWAFFTPTSPVYVGDRLRVQPGNDRAGYGFTVTALKVNKRAVKRGNRGELISVRLPPESKVRPKDLVFKLSTGKLFSKSLEACRRQLDAAPVIAHQVRMEITCTGNTFTISARAKNYSLEKIYDIETVLADKNPLNEEILKKVFVSTGNSRLKLYSLNVYDLPPVVIKPSRLKAIRRDFYASFYQGFSEWLKRERDSCISGIVRLIDNESVKDVGKNDQGKLFVVTDMVQDFCNDNEYGIDTFIVSLKSDLYSLVKKKKIPLKKIIWDLPSIVFNNDWGTLHKNVNRAIADGYLAFRINNISHLQLFTKRKDCKIYAGTWLYTLNSRAMQVGAGYGIDKWFFSIEDDALNMQKLLLAANSDDCLITVYSPVDLFTSRIKPNLSMDQFTLTNEKDESLFVTHSKGLSITQAAKPFSLLGQIEILRTIGYLHFVVDLRGKGVCSVQGQEILQAFFEDRALPCTTPFNFKRGLQ